jgi:hypothetical protein
MSPLQGDIFGGAGGNDHLNGLSGMFNSRDIGGRTLGGLGTSGLGMGGLGIGGGTDNLGSNVHLDSVRSLRQGDGYGAGIDNDNKNGGSGSQGGASSSPSSTPRTGTWSGMGIQSKLSDKGA